MGTGQFEVWKAGRRDASPRYPSGPSLAISLRHKSHRTTTVLGVSPKIWLIFIVFDSQEPSMVLDVSGPWSFDLWLIQRSCDCLLLFFVQAFGRIEVFQAEQRSEEKKRTSVERWQDEETMSDDCIDVPLIRSSALVDLTSRHVRVEFSSASEQRHGRVNVSLRKDNKKIRNSWSVMEIQLARCFGD